MLTRTEDSGSFTTAPRGTMGNTSSAVRNLSFSGGGRSRGLDNANFEVFTGYMEEEKAADFEVR